MPQIKTGWAPRVVDATPPTIIDTALRDQRWRGARSRRARVSRCPGGEMPQTFAGQCASKAPSPGDAHLSRYSPRVNQAPVLQVSDGREFTGSVGTGIAAFCGAPEIANITNGMTQRSMHATTTTRIRARIAA